MTTLQRERLTPAQVTALAVLKAASASTSLCIPGAYERRAVSGPSEATQTPPPASPRTIGSLELGRLEYAREGGGAARERGGPRRDSLFGRLWRRVMFGPARS